MDKKEISMDLEALVQLEASTMASLPSKLTPVELFMQSLSRDSVQSEFALKEAIIDCLETLSEQDQFIINAAQYEMISFKEIGKRLGVSGVHAWRLYNDALANMKQIMMMDERVLDFLEQKGTDNG